MPVYRVTDPKSGKTLKLTGDSPPTEEELNEIFAQSGKKSEDFVKGAFQKAGDLIAKPLAGLQAPLKETKKSVPQKKETLFGLPKDIEGAIFPTASQIPKGESLKKDLIIGGVGAAEAVDLPTRLLSKLRTNPETGEKFKASDPQAMFFRPETEKVKKGIDKISPVLSVLSKGFKAGSKIIPGGGPLASIGTVADPKFQKGLAEMVGSVVSDPTLLGGLVKKGGKKLFGKVGKKATKKKAQQKAIKEISEEFGEDVLPSAAKPKKGLEKIFSRISEADRSVLAEPINPKDLTVEKLAVVAEEAIKNPRNITPLDLAGRKALDALDEVGKLKKSAGAAKGKIVKKGSEKIINTSNLKAKWRDLLEKRLKGEVKDGKIVNIFDTKKSIDRFDELPMVEKINSIIDDLDDDIFAIEADGVKQKIAAAIDAFKNRPGAAPQATITEGIGKELRGTLDDDLVAVLGDEYRKSNREFARLKNIENQLSRRLGETITTDEGQRQAKHGASLLKSAIQSNADRNTKIMFSEIKKLTGIDLIKNAKLAEITMKAVDDPRVRNLLDEIGSNIPGKTGAIVKTGGKIAKKLRKPKMEEVLEFAKKSQGTPFEAPFSLTGAPALSRVILNLAKSDTGNSLADLMTEKKKQKDKEEEEKKSRDRIRNKVTSARGMPF